MEQLFKFHRVDGEKPVLLVRAVNEKAGRSRLSRFLDNKALPPPSEWMLSEILGKLDNYVFSADKDD